MDIFQRLKADHDRQRALVRTMLQSADRPEEALRLLAAFRDELEAHEAAEEQTLQAEVLALSRDVQLVRRCVEDHDAIARLATALADTDPRQDGWFGGLERLKALLELHLDDEENRIFGQLRAAISRERAEALAERFEKLKAEEAGVWGNSLSTLLDLRLAEPVAAGH